jgi:hypothetical protein
VNSISPDCIFGTVHYYLACAHVSGEIGTLHRRRLNLDWRKVLNWEMGVHNVLLLRLI